MSAKDKLTMKKLKDLDEAQVKNLALSGFRFVTDRRVGLGKKILTLGILVVIAVATLISPLDLIPDVVPFFGTLDDSAWTSGVVAFIVKWVSDYTATKAYDNAMSVIARASQPAEPTQASRGVPERFATSKAVPPSTIRVRLPRD